VRTQILCVYIVLGFIIHQASGAESDSTSHLIIRSIRIEGNSVTQSQVITREMALHVGDSLSEAKLIQDRDHIYNLELFNKVTVTHADTAAFADLLVTVIERWYIFPYPNFDLRSRDMSTLSYGLGVSDQNFLGRNEKLSVSFITGYNKTASLNYQNPRLIDQDIFLRTTFSYRDSHNLSNSSNEFEQINRLASLSLGKRFGLFQTLIGTIGYQQWQIPDTSLGRTVSPDGTDRFLEFGLEYTYDARNVREYPTDGFYFDATTMNHGFGGESRLSKRSPMRAIFDGIRYGINS
jgi:outer membrane protein insertion porin family